MEVVTYVLVAAVIVVSIIALVTSSRINSLSSSVSNIQQGSATVYRDSALALGKQGIIMPKRYYWVKVISVQLAPDTTDATSDVATATIDVTDGTDGQALVNDVRNRRVTHIFVPDMSRQFAVSVPTSPSNSIQYKLKKTSTGLAGDKHVCVVGLPDEPVTNG